MAWPRAAFVIWGQGPGFWAISRGQGPGPGARGQGPGARGQGSGARGRGDKIFGSLDLWRPRYRLCYRNSFMEFLCLFGIGIEIKIEIEFEIEFLTLIATSRNGTLVMGLQGRSMSRT